MCGEETGVPHVSWFSRACPERSRRVGRKVAGIGGGWLDPAGGRGPRMTKAPTSRKEREKWGTPIVLIAGDVGHPAAPKVKDTTLGA